MGVRVWASNIRMRVRVWASCIRMRCGGAHDRLEERYSVKAAHKLVFEP